MHVEITIVAKDYDRGKQSTRKEEVEIPGRVLKLFEMFTGNDQDQLLRWVAETVFGTAVREVQGGGKSGNLTSAMESAGGGRIGGRSVPGENRAADNLAEQLGLDVIRRDVARSQRRAAPPPQQMAPPPQGPPQMGPGPVGFGPPPQQQQMGPGPIGYSANLPINPGPGPGPVGFGPDRSR